MRAESVPKRLLVLMTFALVALVATSCGSGTNGTIRIGVFGDCWGPFTSEREQTVAGAELPFIRRGAKPKGTTPSDGVGSVTIAGKRVELLLGCDFFGSDVQTFIAARRLAEQQGVDVLLTPTTILDDLAMRLYEPRQPHVAFISPGLTPRTALASHSNLFRVAPDLRQFSAGLGAYAYRTLGWRTAVTVGEDDPLGYSLTAGFVAEFCSLGGTVVRRFWPAGLLVDWPRLVQRIPQGVDGVALMEGIFSTKGFYPVYKKVQPDLRRHVVTSATAIAAGDRPVGIMAAGPLPFVSNAAAWTRYGRDLRAAFPQYRGATHDPADVYAYDAVELALEGIERVHGDLSGGERRFMTALTSLHVQTPAGVLHLDRSHRAVSANFLIRVERDAKGKVVPLTIGVVPNVDASFGGYFTPSSPPDSRTQPACRKGHVPPWAR
jgi:branched-chain amino acid transport system substrate-binding protein